MVEGVVFESPKCNGSMVDNSWSSILALHQGLPNTVVSNGYGAFQIGVGNKDRRLETTTSRSSVSSDPCPHCHDPCPHCHDRNSNPATALCARGGTVVASYSTGHVRVFDTHKK